MTNMLTDNADSFVADFLLDFKDSRITIGFEERSKGFIVRVENKIIAVDENLKDVIWTARANLAIRKVKTLAAVRGTTKEELGRALKTAASYLDDKMFTMLCMHISSYPEVRSKMPDTLTKESRNEC